MKQLLYIKRLALAVILLMLMALAPAMAQNVVYQGQPTPLGVEQKGFDTYTWDLYNDSTVNFATKTGTAVADGDAQFVDVNTGTPVMVIWNKPGTYFFKVISLNVDGCTMNFKMGKIKVLNALPTAIITEPDTAGVCIGLEVALEVTLTGTAPWKFTYTDGTTDWEITNITTNIYNIVLNPKPATTTVYWIKSVTDKFGTNTALSNKVTQIINPMPDPSKIYHR